MFKYVLFILIFLAIFLLMNPVAIVKIQPIILGNKYTTINEKGNKAENEISQKNMILTKVVKWQKHKLIKEGGPITGLIKGIVEIKSWKYYKKTFISNDGRIIDFQRGSVTTSEGQAYAMRRAVMMDDKKTFDKVYDWTKNNLQHKHDKLFAWLWGPTKAPNPGNISGSIQYGIIDQNGATDAGVEIAIDLILASKIWKQESYMKDALAILDDIWNKETIVIRGERILVAGINQKLGKNVEVNPSYFMPYGFRIFAEVDEKHNWQTIVNSSYKLTNICIDNIESGLPPDSFYINKLTGDIIFDPEKSDFSYDAVRVFYRFFVDYLLTKDSRAEKLLSKSKIFIVNWRRDGFFFTNYKQNGKLKDYNEPIGSIALLLPVIKYYDKNTAEDIYRRKILSQYHFKGYWEDPLNYYAQNLVWFGVWLYQSEGNVRAYKY